MVRGWYKCGEDLLGELRRLKDAAQLGSGLALRWSPESIFARGEPGAIPRARWVGGLPVIWGRCCRSEGSGKSCTERFPLFGRALDV